MSDIGGMHQHYRGYTVYMRVFDICSHGVIYLGRAYTYETYVLQYITTNRPRYRTRKVLWLADGGRSIRRSRILLLFYVLERTSSNLVIFCQRFLFLINFEITKNYFEILSADFGMFS